MPNKIRSYTYHKEGDLCIRHVELGSEEEEKLYEAVLEFFNNCKRTTEEWFLEKRMVGGTAVQMVNDGNIDAVWALLEYEKQIEVDQGRCILEIMDEFMKASGEHNRRQFYAFNVFFDDITDEDFLNEEEGYYE